MATLKTHSYRQATTNDREELFKLYRMAMQVHISKIWGWNEAWQRSDFSEHFDPEQIMVAVIDNTLAGYSQIENQNEHLFLRMLAVHPAHQQQGIGKELLISLLSSATEQSKKIELQVFKINTEAIKFYKKHGFIVKNETPASYVMQLKTQQDTPQ